MPDVVRGEADVPAHGDGAEAVEDEDVPKYTAAFLLLRPVLGRGEVGVGTADWLAVGAVGCHCELAVFHCAREGGDDGPGFGGISRAEL